MLERKIRLLLTILSVVLVSGNWAQNVGIGINTPTEKLHVVGNVRITSLGGAGNALVLTDNNGVFSRTALSGNATDMLDGTGTFVPAPTGDITSVTAGSGVTGGGTTGAVTVTANANNGLNVDAAADAIQLGGALIENTTITNGAFGLNVNLNSTGDFTVQDNGTSTFLVRDDGVSLFGDDVYWRDANTGGTTLMLLSDDGDDGRLRIYENGVTAVDLDANTQYIFNENSADRNFRVESNGNANMFFVDGGTNRVGIGTGAPSTTLDINGTIRIRGGGPTVGDMLMCNNANGTATWSASGYGLVPIGSIIAWHGNMAGTPALPAGWLECNGQTVTDGASPMNGVAVPNLNSGTTSQSGDASRGRFLRGNTTSGLYQGDASNNLNWINHDDSGNGDTNDNLPDNGGTVTIRNYSTSGDRYQARLDGVETRVTNMSVRWIIRIK